MFAPDCSRAVADPSQLWPPNHKFVDVTIAGVVDPDGDPVTITVTGVTQDEAIDSEDGANPCPDASGVGTSTARIRAERSGSGDGRVYHVAFVADDGRGGQCTGAVAVCVPHDQRSRRSCVDQGALFDSTVNMCTAQCSGTCDVEMAASSVCAGQKLPHSLQQQVDRSRMLLRRAADETDTDKAARLKDRAMQTLDRVARVAGHLAQKGKISGACAHEISMMVTQAASELGTPTP
jgi:hypothetical protein